MIKGNRGTPSVWSENLNNLLPFYRDTLGMKVNLETPGFVLLGDGSAASILALGTHSEVHGKSKEPQRVMVGLESSDARADYARLKAAGVEFLEEPTDGGQVVFCSFKDPEDNILQLVQFKG